jgi:hypothetical protein
VGDAEAEAFVQAASGVELDDSQTDGRSAAGALVEHPRHDRGADTATLERAVDEDRPDEGLAVARNDLQPSHIDAVELDEAHLRRVPVRREAGLLRLPLQPQAFIDPADLGEVDAAALIEVGIGRWPKRHGHRSTGPPRAIIPWTGACSRRRRQPVADAVEGPRVDP